MTTVKTHWNSFLHHQDTRYACFDVKDFYICSKIPLPECARIAVQGGLAIAENCEVWI